MLVRVSRSRDQMNSVGKHLTVWTVLKVHASQGESRV